MLGFKLINNINSSFATDDFVVRTYFFDTRTHFHPVRNPFFWAPVLASIMSLLRESCGSRTQRDSLLILLRFAIGDSALRKVVRGQLNRHAITRYDTNKMFTHLPSDMSYYLVAVFKLDFKLSTRKRLNNCARKLDNFFINCHQNITIL